MAKRKQTLRSNKVQDLIKTLLVAINEKIKITFLILKIIEKEDVNTIMHGIKKPTRLNVKCNRVSQSPDKQTSR